MYVYYIKFVGFVSKSKSDLYAFMKLVFPKMKYKIPEEGGPTTMKVF